jgi:type I restriction enzyme, S subunit
MGSNEKLNMETGWINDIPDNWELKKLKYLVNTTKGFAFKSELFGDEGIPVIKTTDIKNGEIQESNIFINEELVSNYDNVRLRENDIVMSTVGSKPEVINSAVGQIGKVQKKFEGALLNQNAVILRCKSDEIFVNYLYYFSISNPYRKYLDLYAHGTANQASLSLKDILDFSMPLPPIETQLEISNFLDNTLDNLQSLINSKQLLIRLLEERRQAIITEAVTKGLKSDVRMKESGMARIGEIPEHWEIKRLKNISNIQPSNVDKKTNENEVPVFLCNYTDVYYNDEINENIDFMQATANHTQIDKFTLKKNDVIITKDSESPTDIAIPAWVGMDLEGVLCGYHLAHIRPNSDLDGKYLFYSFKSIKIREQFYSEANGVTRYGLSKDSIKNGIFVYPPFDEQVMIGDYLYKVNNEINNVIMDINIQIGKLNEYRRSIITEAVTGKIDVREFKKVMS